MFNVTDSTNDIIGTPDFTNDSVSVQTRSTGSGRITIASSKTFEIRHRCNLTKTNNGFGVAADLSGSSSDSVYTIVEIYKEA